MASFFNVGRMDRSVRIVLGVGLGIAGIPYMVILILAPRLELPELL